MLKKLESTRGHLSSLKNVKSSIFLLFSGHAWRKTNKMFSVPVLREEVLTK